MSDSPTTTCSHTYPVPGSRIPRVYGTGPTEHCMACGAWRPAWFPNAEWRSEDALAEAMKYDDER